jgi:hypothetical protein
MDYEKAIIWAKNVLNYDLIKEQLDALCIEE